MRFCLYTQCLYSAEIHSNRRTRNKNIISPTYATNVVWRGHRNVKQTESAGRQDDSTRTFVVCYKYIRKRYSLSHLANSASWWSYGCRQTNFLLRQAHNPYQEKRSFSRQWYFTISTTVSQNVDNVYVCTLSNELPLVSAQIYSAEKISRLRGSEILKREISDSAGNDEVTT